jgi:hypothetical protein
MLKFFYYIRKKTYKKNWCGVAYKDDDQKHAERIDINLELTCFSRVQ